MSDATTPQPADPGRSDDVRDETDEALDDTPAAAGGRDDERPAQGGGEENSY